VAKREASSPWEFVFVGGFTDFYRLKFVTQSDKLAP
jgi:hypothetical protein